VTNKFLVAIISLSTLLIGQSVWAVNKLQNLSPVSQPVNSPTKTTNLQTSSILGLTSEVKEFKAGQSITVDLYVQPASETKVQALDALINFDKDSLAVLKITPLLDSKMAEYPQNKFDNLAGKIWFSAILPKSAIGQRTNIAVLSFTALKPGSTAISFNFQKGKTTDSNVVLENQTTDSLNSVQNLTLNIQP